MKVRVGIPYLGGELSIIAAEAAVDTLVSAGSLWSNRSDRRKGFVRIPDAAWKLSPALDSAGFTAMKLGGYRWTIDQFVQYIATNGGDARDFPWAWWSAMDFCCEEEIAPNRAEVERRMRLTVETYGDMLDVCEEWRLQGITDLPDPMPILQGRTVEDYLWSARAMTARIDERHACKCPGIDVEAVLAGEADDCPAEWHREHAGLPDLIGIGSVCRRELHGPSGLLPIVACLDLELPKRVKLHLFGVKSDALDWLGPYKDRIASIDSMAWDLDARYSEGPSSNAKRKDYLTRWAAKQKARWAQATIIPSDEDARVFEFDLKHGMVRA